MGSRRAPPDAAGLGRLPRTDAGQDRGGAETDQRSADEAQGGEVIQVGDRIKISNSLGGVSVHTVTRVTKTRAYIKFNERAEGCFRRDVNRVFGPQPIPKKDHWSSTRYEWIPQ
jgi:hypothetical protein